jgi:hypothetical protein
MDEKLKKRIIAFYVGGVVNSLLGLYVLLEGEKFLAPDTQRWLIVIFFVFAAVDFYFPHALRKKWLADRAATQAHDGNDTVQRS